MPAWTTLTAFGTQVDSVLSGITTADLPAADRKLAVREAIEEYNRLEPKTSAVEFAGDGGAYYLLHGKTVDVSEALQDAGIDLTTSGAGSKLAIAFTITRQMVLHEIGFYLQRVGTETGKTITISVYTNNSGLPATLIESADTIGLIDDQGPPAGRYAKVIGALANPVTLPAGTYHAVIESNYTYADGTREIIVGVQQEGSPTNTVSTFDGSVWTAYGTDSAGILEVTASTPGWRAMNGEPESVEYPAAAVSSNEEPMTLEREDWQTYYTEQGMWLRFAIHRPSSTETVRLRMRIPYEWIEGDNPRIDTPAYRFRPICFLAAAYCCDRLATKYGQKRSSTLQADLADRSEQASFYKGQAKRWRELFEKALGMDKEERTAAASYVGDLDLQPTHGNDFFFHGRRTR